MNLSQQRTYRGSAALNLLTGATYLTLVNLLRQFIRPTISRPWVIAFIVMCWILIIIAYAKIRSWVSVNKALANNIVNERDRRMSHAVRTFAIVAANCSVTVGTISCASLVFFSLRAVEPLPLVVLAVAVSSFAVSGLWVCGRFLRKGPLGT